MTRLVIMRHADGRTVELRTAMGRDFLARLYPEWTAEWPNGDEPRCR